jgi:hypothetical protein
LVDGAVAEWRKTGKKILPSVDLADIVLARRGSAVEPAVSIAVTPFGATADSAADERVPEARRLVEASSTPSRSRTVRRAAATALALAVAASVSLFWYRPGQRDDFAITDHRASAGLEKARNGRDPSPSLAASNQPRTVPAPPQSARPIAETPAPIEAMVQGAQAAYVDLANEAAQAVTGATAFVPRPSLASVMAPSRDENDRWVDDVGHQFEPVGKNLSQAFQFIFEAVPADKAPAT